MGEESEKVRLDLSNGTGTATHSTPATAAYSPTTHPLVPLVDCPPSSPGLLLATARTVCARVARTFLRIPHLMVAIMTQTNPNTPAYYERLHVNPRPTPTDHRIYVVISLQKIVISCFFFIRSPYPIS